MSLWLSKKRKSELVELAEELGISTEGHLKSDIENLISSYLDENSDTYSNDSTFAPYYDSLGPRSPTKSVSAISVLPEGTTRARRRTSRYVPGTSTREDSYESTPEPQTKRASSRALTARTPRSRVAASIPLPPSPAQVADAIESRSRIIAAKAKQVAAKVELGQKVENVRDTTSNLISVLSVLALYETARVLGFLVPIIKAGTLPAYEIAAVGLKTQPRDLHFPDLFVLLSIAFWQPLTAWLTVGYILPAINGYFFNLALSASSKPKSTWKVDPVAFGVTKGLLAYLVYWRGFDFYGALGSKSVEIVTAAVGKEGPLIGSAIATLAGLYVAILKK